MFLLRIHTEDGVRLVMLSDKDRDLVVKEMPILGKLLFGFQMEMKDKADLNKEFCLEPDSVIGLIKAIKTDIFPESEYEQSCLWKTIITLGGCPKVEALLVKVQTERDAQQAAKERAEQLNILRPKDDLEGVYEWRIAHCDVDDFRTYQEQGFIAVYRDNPSLSMYNLRRLKS
jgi:hypothetical protein